MTAKTNLFDLPVFDEPPQSSKKGVIAGGVILAALAAVGAAAFAAAYILSPTFHTFVNHTISPIQHGQMSVGEGLLYIALPVGGTALLLGLGIHFYNKHRERIKKKPPNLDDYNMEPSTNSLKEIGTSLKQSIKAMRPTRRQFLIGMVAIGALALLAAGGFLIFHFVPVAHHWLHHQAIPILQNYLHHKIQIWQGLAYMGGGTAAAALITGVAILLFQNLTRRLMAQPLEMDYLGYEERKPTLNAMLDTACKNEEEKWRKAHS